MWGSWTAQSPPGTQSRGLLFGSNAFVCSVGRWGHIREVAWNMPVYYFHYYYYTYLYMISPSEYNAWKDRSIPLPIAPGHGPECTTLFKETGLDLRSLSLRLECYEINIKSSLLCIQGANWSEVLAEFCSELVCTVKSSVFTVHYLLCNNSPAGCSLWKTSVDQVLAKW